MERWYLATLLALILHQIDAAFWQEWTMFHVPGGIQGFLLFNLFAVGAVLWGYRHALLGTSTARGYALVCGALGIGTALIHLALPCSVAMNSTCRCRSSSCSPVLYRVAVCCCSSARDEPDVPFSAPA